MPTPYSKILVVSGAAAAKFLQGQLSCDVLALADGQNAYGAYCNLKGKVDYFLRLSRNGADYTLLLPTELIDPLKNELHKYAVFSKVGLNIIEQMTLIDDAAEIAEKIPEVYASTTGMFFPHDLNLPTLGAVSFTKGCYRGQEIVARMQHRGNIKRSLYLFQSNANNIHAGDIVSNSDNEIVGTVVRTAKAENSITGLAVLTDSLHAQNLFVNSSPITLSLDPQ